MNIGANFCVEIQMDILNTVIKMVGLKIRNISLAILMSLRLPRQSKRKFSVWIKLENTKDPRDWRTVHDRLFCKVFSSRVCPKLK